jgi:hypothetical protein
MNKRLQTEDAKQLDEMAQGSTPINTAFSYKVTKALLKYQSDKGHLSTQDVVRLAVSNFLTKAGYL